MMLSDSDKFWIEQVLRPIALLPIPIYAADTDVVATIWANRRYADDTQIHTIKALEVRDARRIYEKVSALIAPTPKEPTDG
jgi:hypothetical protein|tara:strand:+ start:604 stop:846 length:243 start_codon:yes stop_codon:yes gene_type:complete